jgi:hypothetical protein
MTREEALALRRVLDGFANEDDKRIGQELHTGLGQHLYDTRENFA